MWGHSADGGLPPLAQGVPIRLELGPKDLEAEAVVLARRDTGAKETCAWTDIARRVPELLEQIQARPPGLLRCRTPTLGIAIFGPAWDIHPSSPLQSIQLKPIAARLAALQ